MKTAGFRIVCALVAAFAFSATAEAGKPDLRPVVGYSSSAPAYGTQLIAQNKKAKKNKNRSKNKNRGKKNGNAENLIPPSVALRQAMRASPGSKGLGVRLLNRSRPVYAVKLKSGNRVHRVLVDALTGDVIGR